MKTCTKTIFIPVLFVALLAQTSTLHAAVSLTATETSVNVTAGSTFSITLNLSITGDEEVAGLTYFWEVPEATAGMFSITGRDMTGCFFEAIYTTNANALASPYNQLTPINTKDLGAGSLDGVSSISTGTHFLATYSFTVGESVVGTYNLHTSSGIAGGYATPDFDSPDFDAHASITVNVMAAPIPEPASVALLVGAISAMVFGISRRLKQKQANS